jgi:hypothetical protein
MALDPVTAALEIGGKLIDRWFPDPVIAADKKLDLIKLQQSGDLAIIAGQTDINKIEASSQNLFVSGWRPFIGWVCGAACAWNWIGISVANVAFTLFQHPVTLKSADITDMMPILIGMLGLGGLRTVEKIQGSKG